MRLVLENWKKFLNEEKESVPHDFPKPHRDYVCSTIKMQVPVNWCLYFFLKKIYLRDEEWQQ